MNLDMKSSGLQINVYEDFESAEALKEDWNNLVLQMTAPNIFTTWEWVQAWWKWFGKGKQLRLVVATDDSEIVGILPAWFGRISIAPGLSVPGIGLIGDGGPVCPEYLGPIVRERHANRVAGPMIDSLLSASDRWRVFRLSDVLLEGAGVKSLIAHLSSNYLTRISEGERCFYRVLPSDYQVFLGELSSKRRKTVRQTLNKAKKQHNVRLECIAEPDSLERAFSVVYDIYERSLRGQDKLGGWARNDYRGFHSEVARALAEQDWLRLFILWFDEIPVAFLYCYIYGNVLWAYQTAFDSAYSGFGPGSIIFQMAIEESIGEGAREFDFLRGDENYKFHFAVQERPQNQVMIFRNRGISYFAYNIRRKLSYLKRNLRKR